MPHWRTCATPSSKPSAPDTVVKCRESRERARSEAIDRVVTNKYLALPLFFAIMLGIFFLTFEVIGAFLSDLLAAGIDALTAAVDSGLDRLWH